MGRAIRNMAVAAAMALALPLAVQGQVIYGGAGILSDVGDIGDVTDAGFLALAGVVFPVSESGFGVGVEGLYSSLGATDSDGSIDILGALATVGLSFNAEGNVHPYIYGGAGIVNLDADDEASGTSDSETKFGFQGVAGVDFGVSDNVGIFVEGRYLGSSSIDDEAGGDSVSLQALGGAVGISIGVG
ncbi:MAG: outer membrane beta-barrel protein [Gemmatimonadota bacterium]|nr:outer membrane beta-barrel protein [Gemmatimonadota bacterium]